MADGEIENTPRLEEARDVSIEKKKKKRKKDPVEFIIEIKRDGAETLADLKWRIFSRGGNRWPRMGYARLPSASGMGACSNERKQGGEEEREEDLCRFVHERGHIYRLVNRVLNGLAGIDFR